MNDKLWDRSREGYEAYRDSKRGLLRTHKRHNSTYYQLEYAFKNYMDAHNHAANHLDTDHSEELLNTYHRFRRAKLDHDASREKFSEAFQVFKRKEVRYSVVIFNGLKAVFNAKVSDIAKIFGIWNSTITRWKRGDKKELEDHYDSEFGVD